MKCKIGVFSILFFSHSAFSDRPPKIDFSEEGGNKVTFGFSQREAPVEIPSLGFVELIQNPNTTDPLGSLTRICLADTKRDWYITASHVLDDQREFSAANGKALHVEMDDDLMDLALLSTEKTNSPCVSLAPLLSVGIVFNIGSAFPQEQSEIEIEAMSDPTTRKIQSHRMKTVLASHFLSGISGHDETGPLVSLLARGIRGQSGGAVFGEHDIYGNLGSYRTVPLSGRRLLGMILAADDEGREMVILPAPTIQKRLEDYFSKSKPDFVNEGEFITGGIRYLKTGAIHYRTSLHSSGTGHLGDGGRRSSNLSTPITSLSTPKAGIRVGEKLWLGITEKDPMSGWVEYEAISSFYREKLSKPENLQGIYETPGGKLQSIGLLKNLGILHMLNIPDGFTDAYLEKFNISTDEMLQTYMSGGAHKDSLLPCVSTLGFLREKGQDLSTGVLVIVCEEDGHDGLSHFFGLHVIDPLKKVHSFSLVTQMKIGSVLENGVNDLSVKAFYSEKNSDIRFGKDRHSYLSKGYSFLKSLEDGKSLNRRGLREFYSTDFSARLERWGGYHLINKNWVVEGPASMSGIYVIQKGLGR